MKMVNLLVLKKNVKNSMLLMTILNQIILC